MGIRTAMIWLRIGKHKTPVNKVITLLRPIKDMHILHLVGNNELPKHFAHGYSL